MLTRNALDRTARFEPIAAAANLKARTAYVDGEIVVLNDAGISDFGALQEALSAAASHAAIAQVGALLGCVAGRLEPGFWERPVCRNHGARGAPIAHFAAFCVLVGLPLSIMP
jgi:hypothetical protein